MRTDNIIKYHDKRYGCKLSKSNVLILDYSDIAYSCENLTSSGVFFNATYQIKDGNTTVVQQCGFTGV